MGLSPSAVFGLNYKFRLNRGGGAQPRPRSAEGLSIGVETASGAARSEARTRGRWSMTRGARRLPIDRALDYCWGGQRQKGSAWLERSGSRAVKYSTGSAQRADLNIHTRCRLRDRATARCRRLRCAIGIVTRMGGDTLAWLRGATEGSGVEPGPDRGSPYLGINSILLILLINIIHTLAVLPIMFITRYLF